MKRRPREMTDAELLAFVYWCRINPVHIVTDVHVVRRVMRSYTTGPVIDVEHGAHANREVGHATP